MKVKIILGLLIGLLSTNAGPGSDWLAKEVAAKRDMDKKLALKRVSAMTKRKIRKVLTKQELAKMRAKAKALAHKKAMKSFWAAVYKNSQARK